MRSAISNKNVHTFKSKSNQYKSLFTEGYWSIVKYKSYPNVGISHTCQNSTWTKKVNRISHLFLRSSPNYTCAYCYKELPESIYGLWALMNWDIEGDLLRDV